MVLVARSPVGDVLGSWAAGDPRSNDSTYLPALLPAQLAAVVPRPPEEQHLPGMGGPPP